MQWPGVLCRRSRQQNALLGHHRPQICSTLHFIATHCIQIVLNIAHCSSEGYTPVGDSAVLANVICPAWLGKVSLFPRVKCKTRTVLAKQGLASLHSSKYVDSDGSAAIQCFVWLSISYFELKTCGAAAPTRNTCSLRSQFCHSQ